MLRFYLSNFNGHKTLFTLKRSAQHLKVIMLSLCLTFCFATNSYAQSSSKLVSNYQNMENGLPVPSLQTEEMLKKIQCSNFAAYDMLLYLDTHSDDKKAFRMFQALVKKTKELKCEYEEKFGPLNQFSTAMQDEFNWLDNPWTWEKEANK